MISKYKIMSDEGLTVGCVACLGAVFVHKSDTEYAKLTNPCKKCGLFLKDNISLSRAVFEDLPGDGRTIEVLYE